MKKRFLAVACTIALTLGLFLLGCQKQEEAAKETAGYGEKAEETAGYGEKAEETAGYGEEKAAETGGYGEKSDTGGYK